MKLEVMDNGLSEYELVDDTGETVAYMAAAGDSEQARHIVHCVNNHELAKGKLKTLRDSISGDCYMGEEWELETIDAIIGGMDEG